MTLPLEIVDTTSTALLATGDTDVDSLRAQLRYRGIPATIVEHGLTRLVAKPKAGREFPSLKVEDSLIYAL